MLEEWQTSWKNGDTGRKIYIIMPSVSLRPTNWIREDVIFFSQHGPFPAYLKIFHLSDSYYCSCGGIGTALHYATECIYTVSWHMRKPAANFEQEWLKRVANNLVSRKKIRGIIKFIRENRDLFRPPQPSTSQRPELNFPSHPRTITCLFADDSAVLAQGTTIKYILRTLQYFLVSPEEWLTKWRIAVNTDKTNAIIFRKGCTNYNPAHLELFEEPIEWVTDVKYLGLIIDNKLTFRQHISYLKEKFWAKIYLCLPLIGRNSSLSLENKLILFKQVLRPILTYAAPIWGLAALSNKKKVQILQNKLLRIIVNAPWFIRNSVIHSDLQIESIEYHIQKLSRKFFTGIIDDPNNLIADQTDFTEFNGRNRYPYAATKWSLPLKPS
ncbi:RNA-directed DNA polymerase from mobile element jockey [Araneus ventricosus]|uniref:RNA-directed DNA polymerase from mobile element jockey n=1 Tax=Araneus ventricosus TaxID=182803 RepID=A0A4Y2KKA8_ARAVE|nr:RNA-directed DNA polymerase from mobile element jockey [Araneus ventricosus]